MKVIFLFFLLIVSLNVFGSVRIYDGDVVQKGDKKWEFVVSLSQHYGHKVRNHCTGNLVAKDWVLTAAHCVDPLTTNEDVEDFNVTKVGYGSYDKRTLKYAEIDYYVMHPGWSVDEVEHDLALVKLKTPIEGIDPVDLNKSFVSHKKIEGMIAGWGHTDAENATSILEEQEGSRVLMVKAQTVVDIFDAEKKYMF